MDLLSWEGGYCGKRLLQNQIKSNKIMQNKHKLQYNLEVIAEVSGLEKEGSLNRGISNESSRR